MAAAAPQVIEKVVERVIRAERAPPAASPERLHAKGNRWWA